MQLRDLEVLSYVKNEAFLMQVIENGMLSGCRFENCVFKNVVFSSSILNNCNFVNCQFIGCIFEDVSVEYCQFNDCFGLVVEKIDCFDNNFLTIRSGECSNVLKLAA